MNRIFILVCLLHIFFLSLHAQTVLHGEVLEFGQDQPEKLVGANVIVLGTNQGTATDSSGHFSLKVESTFPVTIEASLIGYQSQKIEVDSASSSPIRISLQKTVQLKEALVEGRAESIKISTLNPINSSTITGTELLKAACCNLSESFETSPVVDVNQNDAVTGAKQIQLLGLDGIYTQIQAENVPLIRGLSAAYGLNFVPGPWIESIQINKGVGSVINGYESIGGQLNIELKKPQLAEPLFLNGYINHEGREELNLQLAHRFKKNSSTELLVHGSAQTKKVDHNKDGFLDQPLYRQINAYNRWHTGISNKLEMQIGLRALYEDRNGGQVDFNYNRDYASHLRYGVGIRNKMAELFTKTGTINPAKPYQSVALITSFRLHELDSYYGLKTYKASQKSLYLNTIYQTIISDTRHYIRSGLSFNYNSYFEKVNGFPIRTEERIPGAYAEYTYNDLQRFSMVAGVRADYLLESKAFFTPRLHLKYNFSQLTALRFSIGSGWRTARVYAENANIFASSRTLYLGEKLKPEEAWNGGMNFTHKFRLFHRDAVFNTDYYYSQFTNQVIVDLEDIHEVRFYNLSGKSYAHYLQGEITVEPLKDVVILLAYKHTEAWTTYGTALKRRPFIPRDKGLINVEYKTPGKKWAMNNTGKIYGYSRIPSGGLVHHGYEIKSQSLSYLLFNAQVTYFLKQIELYAGAENIGNFTQHQPIVAAESPFSSSFDASLVWGPIMGRIIYTGFRWKPFNAKK